MPVQQGDRRVIARIVDVTPGMPWTSYRKRDFGVMAPASFDIGSDGAGGQLTSNVAFTLYFIPAASPSFQPRAAWGHFGERVGGAKMI